jgi:hypothetical protein
MTTLGVANSHLKHLETNYSRPIVNLNMFKPIIKASLDPTETDLSDVSELFAQEAACQRCGGWQVGEIPHEVLGRL